MCPEVDWANRFKYVLHLHFYLYVNNLNPDIILILNKHETTNCKDSEIRSKNVVAHT